MKPIEEQREEQIYERLSSSSFERKLSNFNNRNKTLTPELLAKPRPTVTKKISYVSNDRPVTEILSSDRQLEERMMKQSPMSKKTKIHEERSNMNIDPRVHENLLKTPMSVQTRIENKSSKQLVNI